MSAAIIPIGRARVVKMGNGPAARASARVIDDVGGMLSFGPLNQEQIASGLAMIDEAIRMISRWVEDPDASELAKACCYEYLLKAARHRNRLEDLRTPPLAIVLPFPKPKRRRAKGGRS